MSRRATRRDLLPRWKCYGQTPLWRRGWAHTIAKRRSGSTLLMSSSGAGLRFTSGLPPARREGGALAPSARMHTTANPDERVPVLSGVRSGDPRVDHRGLEWSWSGLFSITLTVRRMVRLTHGWLAPRTNRARPMTQNSFRCQRPAIDHGIRESGPRQQSQAGNGWQARDIFELDGDMTDP